MKNKIIIGLIGKDKKANEKVAKIFSDAGFYKTSISSKTNELAKYLLPGNVFPDETISEIRERGYKVSDCYWINLVLASVPDDKSLVLIEDISEKDIVDGVVTAYQVTNDEEKSNLNIINANSKNLKNDIYSKIKLIASR